MSIEITDSNNGLDLALNINGYLFFQTNGADVIAMTRARFLSNGLHAAANEPDLYRDQINEESIVWMSDTDRGHATAWSMSAQHLAKYITSLPPKK